MRILVAEDQDMSRLILATHLREWGHEVIEAANGKEALDLITLAHEPIELLITDWGMPILDGVELAAKVRQLTDKHEYIYIILLTANDEAEDKAKGYEQGGVDDYITKPFDIGDLSLRIKVGERVIAAEREQRRLNNSLTHIVREQTAIIQQTQDEIVHRLFSALEFRDGETGDHTSRIGLMSATLAEIIGWDKHSVGLIKAAAPLHDIGKIGVPDEVLRKPGRLTNEEYDIIKRHAEIGGNMLTNSTNEVIAMGELIARSHHENWDGSGYPNGLMGEDIPIEARIVSITDVYDALRSDRVYRLGIPEEKVMQMLLEDRGTKFDAQILDIFLANLPKVKAVLNANKLGLES